MLTKILTIIQIASAVIMIIAIMLQARGSGLSSVFGGESQVFRTKRGIEKTLLIITIIFAILFFGSSFVIILL